MPCEIVFRLNGVPSPLAASAGAAGSRRDLRREDAADRVVAQVEAELLGPLAVDLEDLHVDDDFGARLVVGLDHRSTICTTDAVRADGDVLLVLLATIVGCIGDAGDAHDAG